MLKTTQAVGVREATSAVSATRYRITRMEFNTRRRTAIIRGELLTGEGGDMVVVGSKRLHISVGAGAMAALVGQIENGLKKKFAEDIGFDDTKTTVE